LAALVPPVVGLFILFLFWLTAAETLILIGFFWLPVGGLLTLGLAITAIIKGVTTFSQSGPAALSRRWYTATLATSFLSLVVAVACAAIGLALAQYPPVAVLITNNTSKPVEVTIHFDGGDATYGPIRPGMRERFPKARHAHSGELKMTIHSGGRTATTQAMDHLDEDDMHEKLEFDINEANLP
jgi:hypothetical protein